MAEEEEYDFDVFVIGGGSGGIACARYAATGCEKVGVADFVNPSTQGTTWGLGGTCVNVGCIPKKLMHTSGLFGEVRNDMRECGWDLGDKDLEEHNRHKAFSWEKMVGNVQKHVKSVNTELKNLLMNMGIMYFNGYATITGKHSLQIRMKNGKLMNKKAKYIVVATGGRPAMDSFPGCKEHCLSSDDIFSKASAPGKTLCIGGSYTSLESAGFLRGMGFEVDVMVRSIFLRGFDQEIAEKIGENLQSIGVTILRPTTPNKAEKLENGQIRVYFNDPETKQQCFRDYDTVLVAVGRVAETHSIGLDTLGVQLSKNRKIVCDERCEVQGENTKDVYAIGDCVEGNLELTPTAIMSGKLLAGRLLNVHNELMSMEMVPTTVFTPLEYGSIGLSEDDCIAKLGEDNFSVYAKPFRPLEWEYLGRPKSNEGYIKILTEKEGLKKVLGVHYLGPNAGEVIQGFALAVKMGATKFDFDNIVGIHPTSAENFTTLDTEGKGAKGPC